MDIFNNPHIVIESISDDIYDLLAKTNVSNSDEFTYRFSKATETNIRDCQRTLEVSAKLASLVGKLYNGDITEEEFNQKVVSIVNSVK